jgi:hypothetical protein
MSYSSNQLIKAATAPGQVLAEQNQAMDTANIDITDMVNVIFDWRDVDGPLPNRITPRNAKDVAAIMAEAAARLRVIKEQVDAKTSKRIAELEAEVRDLERECEDLENKLDERS